MARGITEAGDELLAKVVAGAPLIFTRIMFGSGIPADGDDVEKFTYLINPVAQGSSSNPIAMAKTVAMQVLYRNDMNGGLQTAFYASEFGVFARDPDDDSEILLVYFSFAPQYVEAYDAGSILDEHKFNISIYVGGRATIILEYASLSYITMADMEAFAIPLTSLGQPGGPAVLDENGRLSVEQLDDAFMGNVKYQDVFNPDTGEDGKGEPMPDPSEDNFGQYWIAEADGTYAGIDFEVGDWIISHGDRYNKVDNTDAVVLVNGKKGSVVLDGTDIEAELTDEEEDEELPETGTITSILQTIRNALKSIFAKFGAAEGIASLDENATLPLAQLTNPITHKFWDTTLAASQTTWTITVDSDYGVTADTTQVISFPPTVTKAQAEAAAKAMIVDSSQAENQIVLKALGTAPTVPIPIRIVFLSVHT